MIFIETDEILFLDTNKEKSSHLLNGFSIHLGGLSAPLVAPSQKAEDAAR